MQTGIDRLIADAKLRRPLRGRRVALLAHLASVTAEVVHSLDALAALDDVEVTAAFGPQHGLRGSPSFPTPADRGARAAGEGLIISGGG